MGNLCDTDDVKTKNHGAWMIVYTYDFMTDRMHAAVLLEAKWSFLTKNVCFY